MKSEAEIKKYITVILIFKNCIYLSANDRLMNLIRFVNKISDRDKFTLKKYSEFLESISKYKILTCREFQNSHSTSETVIALRHDIDQNINRSVKMAEIESQHEIKSTYFVLHTADYYLKSFDKFKYIQSLGHEIGFHNDLMTLKHPKISLEIELEFLRLCGLIITGTASHGNKQRTDNLAFWEDYKLNDFGLDYEAYSLDHNRYFSDCTFIFGHRWHPDSVNWSEMKAGDRIQILTHPEHWR
jgi:hypothetical protein